MNKIAIALISFLMVACSNSGNSIYPYREFTADIQDSTGVKTKAQLRWPIPPMYGAAKLSFQDAQHGSVVCVCSVEFRGNDHYGTFVYDLCSSRSNSTYDCGSLGSGKYLNEWDQLTLIAPEPITWQSI